MFSILWKIQYHQYLYEVWSMSFLNVSSHLSVSWNVGMNISLEGGDITSRRDSAEMIISVYNMSVLWSFGRRQQCCFRCQLIIYWEPPPHALPMHPPPVICLYRSDKKTLPVLVKKWSVHQHFPHEPHLEILEASSVTVFVSPTRLVCGPRGHEVFQGNSKNRTRPNTSDTLGKKRKDI